MKKKTITQLGILILIMVSGCNRKSISPEESISVISETAEITQTITAIETVTGTEDNDKIMPLQLSMSEDEKLLWEKLIARIYYVTYYDHNGEATEVTTISKDDSQTILYLLQLIVADELLSIPISSFELGSEWFVEKVNVEQLMQNILDVDLSGYTGEALDGYLENNLYRVGVGDYGDGYPSAFFADVIRLNNGDIEIKGYAGFTNYDAVAEGEGVVLHPNTGIYLTAQPFTAHLKATNVPIYTQYSLRDFKWE